MKRSNQKRWINDKVINFYFKKYLAEMDQKRCKEEPEQNCSFFFNSFFWQSLTNEKNDDMTVGGTYDYGNVSRWARKLPGEDIFNLKKIFIPINIENQHWTCIVIFMKEKQIQYYNSTSVGAGKQYMDSVMQYLVNEDKRQHCVKSEELWYLPQRMFLNKKIHLTVVHSFACLATSYHKTLLYFLVKPMSQVSENEWYLKS